MYIHNIQKLARENIIASKIKSKRYYERSILNILNDQVFLLCEPKKGKLSNQYSGSHTILDILSNGIKLIVKEKTKNCSS